MPRVGKWHFVDVEHVVPHALRNRDHLVADLMPVWASAARGECSLGRVLVGSRRGVVACAAAHDRALVLEKVAVLSVGAVGALEACGMKEGALRFPGHKVPHKARWCDVAPATLCRFCDDNVGARRFHCHVWLVFRERDDVFEVIDRKFGHGEAVFRFGAQGLVRTAILIVCTSARSTTDLL